MEVPYHIMDAAYDMFDSLTEKNFMWAPYSMDVNASLPPVCIQDTRLWTTQVSLLLWHIDGHHLPHKVMRQFGLTQEVLPMVVNIGVAIHHMVKRMGNVNYGHMHAIFLQQ